MNSTASPNSGPIIPGQKRSLLDGPCYLKMLVSNLVAGSVIGKNGAVIAQIEATTGVTMKLSPASCTFPGTNERVVVMGGEQHQINAAIASILEKINDAMVSQYAPDVGEARVPRHDLAACIVVPKSAVSGIIGKGGAQIKSLQEKTKAKIQISDREAGLLERVVTITGSLENLHSAAVQVCQIIQEDPNLKEYMFVKYPPPQTSMAGASVYGGGHMGFSGYGAQYLAAAYPYGVAPMTHTGQIPPLAAGEEVVFNEHCEIHMEIPDLLVGGVIGRNGANLAEMMRHTGATIKVAQRGDFVPGTQNRKVIITGPVASVHRAHVRLLFRMKESNGAQATQRGSASYNGGSPSNTQSSPFGPQTSAAQHSAYAFSPMGYQQAYTPY